MTAATEGYLLWHWFGKVGKGYICWTILLVSFLQIHICLYSVLTFSRLNISSIYALKWKNVFDKYIAQLSDLWCFFVNLCDIGAITSYIIVKHLTSLKKIKG